MSRKCPKRNHLFLNWIKANRSRLPFLLLIIRKTKRQIEFEFQRLTKVIRFRCYTQPGYWISIDVMWQGDCWDGLAYFAGGEMQTRNGWVTLFEPEETCNRHWQTREELWEDLCFKVFLAWCNDELAPAHWLELYKTCLGTGAKLHKDRPETNSTLEIYSKQFGLAGIPPDWERLLIPVRQTQVDLSDRFVR